MSHEQKKAKMKAFLKARPEIKIEPLIREMKKSNIQFNASAFEYWITDYTDSGGYPRHWCRNTRNINNKKEIDAVLIFFQRRYGFEQFKIKDSD